METDACPTCGRPYSFEYKSVFSAPKLSEENQKAVDDIVKTYEDSHTRFKKVALATKVVAAFKSKS